jgi:Tim44-like domain
MLLKAVIFALLFQIVAGKMMEQGPVLILSFTAQQIMAIRDTTGRVVEGDPVREYFSDVVLLKSICTCRT